jgi:hypothetical protein
MAFRRDGTLVSSKPELITNHLRDDVCLNRQRSNLVWGENVTKTPGPFYENVTAPSLVRNRTDVPRSGSQDQVWMAPSGTQGGFRPTRSIGVSWLSFELEWD